MKQIDGFKLGDIQVIITETDDPDKYRATCHDKHYKHEFTLNRYEYENYNKLMKNRIKEIFRQQYDK